jgi:hypothetical protein
LVFLSVLTAVAVPVFRPPEIPEPVERVMLLGAARVLLRLEKPGSVESGCSYTNKRFWPSCLIMKVKEFLE